MTSEILPEDVVRHILLMLPVKSLLRFRCVCKTWCHSIKSPNFTATHLNRLITLNKNDCILLKRFLQQSSKSVLSFLHDETLGSAHVPLPSTDIEIPFFKNFVNIYGPSNGILCLTDDVEYVLCNPAIREFKALPLPLFASPTLEFLRSAQENVGLGLLYRTLGVGFGFDPLTNDYKVVRIAEHYIDEDFNDYSFLSIKAEIYNLSTDCWREIKTSVPRVWATACYAPILNGYLHWYANDPSSGRASILSFHISTEVFCTIGLPEFFRQWMGLAVLNESLALILYNSFDAEKYFDIWLMNEYGVEESWVKQFSIGPLIGIERPLSLWKDGELLLESSNGQLVFCDLDTQQVKEFQVYGVPATLRGVVYCESLVSIKRGSELN